MPTDQVPTDVIARYDTPGPRYTSYPTVPAWKGAFGLPEFCEALVELAETESEAAKKQFAINLARALRIATTRPIKGHQLGLRGSQLRLSSRLSKSSGTS